MSEKVINAQSLSPNLADALEHYDHDLADRFYKHVWAGEDIFIGLGWYDEADDHGNVADACREMADRIAALIPNRHNSGARVLDLGAGYGASARHIAREYGFRVDCLNLSEVQNVENRRLNQEYGLDDRIRVSQGNFESLAYPDNSYEVVWSQDSFLHSDSRGDIMEEIDRVLVPGGDIVFTDIMQSEDCTEDELQPVLARFGMTSLATPSLYRAEAEKLGWRVELVQDISPNLIRHYRRVIQTVDSRRDELVKIFGADYLAKVRQGMDNWLDAAGRKHLRWGMFHFVKGE